MHDKLIYNEYILDIKQRATLGMKGEIDLKKTNRTLNGKCIVFTQEIEEKCQVTSWAL